MDAAIAVIMNPLLALYTKFQGSSCLTHVGTEGGGLAGSDFAKPAAGNVQLAKSTATTNRLIIVIASSSFVKRQFGGSIR